jgi:hypothetical protein
MHDVMTLANLEAELVPILALSIGGGIAIIAIIFGSIRKIVQAAVHEKSRREIAAYIAEGSITPEDGARLLEAGRRFDKVCGG